MTFSKIIDCSMYKIRCITQDVQNVQNGYDYYKLQIIILIKSMGKQDKAKQNNYLTSSATNRHKFDLSPSRKTIVKSPASISKVGTSPNIRSTVSYGQLQIILESINGIKEKANRQISHLLEKNKALQEELAICRKSIDEFKEAQSNTDLQKQVIFQKYEIQITEIQKLKAQAQSLLKIVSDQNTSLKQTVDQLRENIKKEEDSNFELTRQVSEANEQLQRVSMIFTSGNPSQLQQIGWKIKNQCPKGLLEFFKVFHQLEKELTAKNQRIQQMVETISQSKEASKNGASMIDKLMDDNSRYASQLQACQNEIRQLESKMREQELAHQQTVKQQQEAIQMHRLEIQGLKSQDEAYAHLKERQISSFISEIKHLKEAVLRYESEERERREKERFDKLIEETCPEDEDLLEASNKIKYLEKFRVEHYYNVEKIEFLCKMLDH